MSERLDSTTVILDEVAADSVRAAVRMLHQVRVVEQSLRAARLSQAALEAIITLVSRAQEDATCANVKA